MATFHIHQDIEKENTIFPIKEKTGKGTALQPVAAAVVGAKDKQRSTFALLSNVNIVRGGGGVGGAGGGAIQKTAFREVKNVKVVQQQNDENAFTQQQQQQKKPSVIPVEQFKTFSVYEDKCFSSTGNDETRNVEGKENIKAAFLAAEESRNSNKDYLPDDSILDTTPMSITDVLSPMSIDRSQISINTSQIDDDNHRKFILATPVPRNDRERFFEVVEYQNCILQYFRESEKNHLPKPNYMKRQPDINYSMRTILVDWLVEVSEEYNLDTETLYLAVSYIDRFLSHMSVVRAKLQLVGTAAMYIASKYEEIYPPDVGEFVFITDDTYTKAQVLRMEQIILKILSFDLCVPTSYVFINTYAVLVDIPEQVKFLTQYIAELSLLEGDPYLRYHPSIVSSAALALARYNIDEPIWSTELEQVTTYRLEDLKEVILHLGKTHLGAGELAQQAIQEKYKSAKYREVASIKPTEINEELFDSIAQEYNEMLKLTSENSFLASSAAAAATTDDDQKIGTTATNSRDDMLHTNK